MLTARFLLQSSSGSSGRRCVLDAKNCWILVSSGSTAAFLFFPYGLGSCCVSVTSGVFLRVSFPSVPEPVCVWVSSKSCSNKFSSPDVPGSTWLGSPKAWDDDCNNTKHILIFLKNSLYIRSICPFFRCQTQVKNGWKWPKISRKSGSFHIALVQLMGNTSL